MEALRATRSNGGAFNNFYWAKDDVKKRRDFWLNHGRNSPVKGFWFRLEMFQEEEDSDRAI